MILRRCASLQLALIFFLATSAWGTGARRLVILKVDGLNQDLLANTMAEPDPATGKSQLPWLSRIFAEQGAIYNNFYTRGISLSAPSWSMLDTGRHTIIRGNVEYDRFTGQVYDYLNFFPLYVGYARQKQVDMPGVQVLDRAGIPLLIDRFQFSQVYQSFQLFQRGVNWITLQEVLKRKFSSQAIFAMLEGASPSYDSLLEKQTEAEIESALKDPNILYLDIYLSNVDHLGHATSEPTALVKELRHVDTLAGQLWTAIQNSPLAKQTVFAMVSDHGMNNVPGVVSQTYSLTDLLNSPAGGAHHVVTNREQLSDFKFKSLYPLLHRVINPSESSFYLRGEANRYPTAWLDIDGNERAALHLRNSDINKIHILLQQLARPELSPNLRKAAALCLTQTIDAHRERWSKTASELDEELRALKQAIDEREPIVAKEPRNFHHEIERLRSAWRLRQDLEDWKAEYAAYSSFLAHLKKLLAFEANPLLPFKGKISDLIPEMSLGDSNTREQLRHYIAGPVPAGLQANADGSLDQENSFRFVDYPKLFSEQRALNRPQPELPQKPIDFVAMRSAEHTYWLYADETSQLEISTDPKGNIAVKPLSGPWRSGLPLELFEDRHLQIPPGLSRQEWLSTWHTEQEWFQAIHQTRYSNGVIGIIEELSPIADSIPGRPGISSVLQRYERRRRELVQADIHLFTTDHWNFNVRFPNPGGNHGSFLRISTHSVWMMAGAGVKPGPIEDPADSLDFVRVLTQLLETPKHY